MSEKVCVWCQRGYSLYGGKHYVVGAERGCVASPPAAPLSTLPERPDEDDTKPVTPHERTLILQRVANHERGHDTGLTTRAVLYLRGYEARLSSLERELDGVRSENAALTQALIDVRARLGQVLIDSQAAVRERSK